MHHTLLCSCEFKFQVFAKECLEMLADSRKHIPLVLTAVVSRVAKDIELNIEQFLEFQPFPCLLHFLLRLWIVHIPHSRITTYKVEWGSDVIGKCFGQCRHLCKHSLGNLLHGT